jgi:enolase
MTKIEIRALRAMQILDSRGNPTVQVYASDSTDRCVASVPSGASTGRHEALELRDSGSQFGGKGVTRAVGNVNGPIAAALNGRTFGSIAECDRKMIELDGTPNKSKLGANAILGVSMAVSRLLAKSGGLELYRYLSETAATVPAIPVPLFNIINGGVHAGGELAIQEFLIVPSGFERFSDALRAASEIYHQLRSHLRKKYGPFATNIGDEGGFVPPVPRTAEALEAILQSVAEAGYTAGREVHLAIDAAASEFYRDGKYSIDGSKLDPAELIDYYQSLISKFHIASIEDPFDEEAFDEFAELNRKIGSRVQIIGDDLYVTNTERIRIGIEKKSTNAVLIKLNQIGTVSETIESTRLTMHSGMNAVVSHRSGETTDDFMADLATGLGTGQMKAGAPARGERVAKYNRLLEIEMAHPEIPFSSVGFFRK